MPVFLDTRGLGNLAIGICDRCRMKRTFVSLGPDTNFPGLRVCDQGCKDQLDPYRLPARQTERINLRFARPDVNIAANEDYLLTTGNNQFYISTQGNTQTPQTNGNNDTIAPSPT